jgi:uncharacterized membrane protein YeaQ/YmgE (transglycosylase-associated protein family)
VRRRTTRQAAGWQIKLVAFRLWRNPTDPPLGQEATLSNVIVSIIVGGSLGWLAGLIMHTDSQQWVLVNIVVGMVGAFVVELVLTPLFGMSTINPSNFSMPVLWAPLLGAISSLAVVSIIRRSIRQQL